MRGATKAAVAVALVGGAAAGVITWAVNRGGDTPTVERPVALSTVNITTRDLVTYNETTATLGFVDSSTVSSPIDGTVTSIVAAGDTVDAGTVVAYIDGAPIVALVGDIPTFRALSATSTDGADIRQLEQNLVVLGYDPNAEIAIDNHFDAATTAAVNRWAADLGVTEDGIVPKTRVVYVPGRLLVDTVPASVGSHVASGGPLLVARVAERKVYVSSTVAAHGALSGIAAPGTEVVTGTVLFVDNGVPVVALVGDPAALPALNRSLTVGVADGADIKLLERMLGDLGFDSGSAITVDDHFDAATAAAVAAWQATLGVAVADPVSVPKGSYVVVPSGLFMSAGWSTDSAAITGDAVVVALTVPAREVATTAPVGDETFVVGAAIEVEFPDGTLRTGTVVEVGTTATNATNTPGDTPTVPITIRVDDIPSSVDSFVQIPVTLRVVEDEAKSALVVPVSALVALAEGGYAVEVVDSTNTDGTFVSHYVAVSTGLFSDGFVAVTGDQLRDGLPVVVPS